MGVHTDTASWVPSAHKAVRLGVIPIQGSQNRLSRPGKFHAYPVVKEAPPPPNKGVMLLWNTIALLGDTYCSWKRRNSREYPTGQRKK